MPGPVVLSRGDSLAIASAINARMEAERAAAGARTQAIADSIRRLVETTIYDSIRRTIAEFSSRRADAATQIPSRGGRSGSDRLQFIIPPPRPGERRVVVVPFANAGSRTGTTSGGRSTSGSGSRSTSGLGDQIADSLRDALIARQQFAVVNESQTREASTAARSAGGSAPIPTLVGMMLFAPAVVTGEYRRDGDSLRVRVQVTCIGCPERAPREAVTAAATPRAVVGLLLDPILSDLANVQWNRSRNLRGPTQQGPPRAVPSPPAPPPVS